LQIFVSYARNDDLPPLESSDGKGFVTALYGHLNYQFKALGPPMPELWRDTRSIGRSDQFDPIIEEAINGSELFLVVLSRNWLSRGFCRKELDMFKQRWAKEGEAGTRRRIVVVAKQHIEFNDRPSPLQGQEGYWFYRRDADEGVGIEQEFFSGGKPQGEYYDLVKRLAVDLWRRAQSEQGQSAKAAGSTTKPSSKSDDARTVYLAKPAADMRPAYLRLVAELQQRGYHVVPERDVEIPSDDTAPTFVERALAGAEVSIHLLGEKSGYTPEDSEPIVKLQLAQAATRAAATNGEAPAQTFRRIIWAPKVVVESAAAAAVERDPLAVLARFDRQLPSDKIDGSEISKFSEFVVQHLDRTSPKAEVLEAIESDSRLYVYHRPEDSEFALDLAKVLQQRKIEPIFPAFEGDPAELKAWHREALQECDAVVLCWATAPEVWIKTTARELRSWRELGREKKFACRGLLAGPPPGERKEFLMELPPRSEIDVVLDLTKEEKLSPESLDPLIRAARSTEASASAPA
jgi:hypothetical protein